MCSVRAAASNATRHSGRTPRAGSTLTRRPLPLRPAAVRALKKEKAIQAAEIAKYENETYPTVTDIPVSETSVKIFGESAWHTQPKKDAGAPPTYVPPEHPQWEWTKRRWDVDHIQHVQEGLGIASVRARQAKQSKA